MTVPPLSELLSEDRIVLSKEGNAIMAEESVHVRLPAKHREISETIARLKAELVALKIEADAGMRSGWDSDQAYVQARAQAETEQYIRQQVDGGREYLCFNNFAVMVTPNILAPHDEINFGTADDTCWSVWHVKEGRAFLIYGERMGERPTQTASVVLQRGLLKWRDKAFTFPHNYDTKGWVEQMVVRKVMLGHEPNWAR